MLFGPQDPQLLILQFIALVFGLCLHEFGHAYVAYLCGDSTAKDQGRMNINPLSHLDLFGTLMILLVGIGYGKPVPVNPNNFKHKLSYLYVAIAGPLMNVLVVMVSVIAINFLSVMQFHHEILVTLLFLLIVINMVLFLFNMIPLGPLDGAAALPFLLPRRARIRYVYWNHKWGTFALAAIVLAEFMIPGWQPLRWIFAQGQSVAMMSLYGN